MNQKWIETTILAGLIGCAAPTEKDVGGVSSTSEADASTTDTAAEGFDEMAVVHLLQHYADALKQVNAQARSSQHGLGDTVNVWVRSDDVAAYLAVDPGDDNARVVFAPGTLLVKEHLDDTGSFAGLTAMAKRPAGADPQAGDWWWARLDQGLVVQESGNVGYCVSCHRTNAEATDLVVGVPLDNR